MGLVNVLLWLCFNFCWFSSIPGTDGKPIETIQVVTRNKAKIGCYFTTTKDLAWFYSRTREEYAVPFKDTDRVFESRDYKKESSLVFTIVLPSDEGYYSYKEFGRNTEEVCVVFLQVLVKASAKCDPQLVTAREFDTVTLNCSAMGSPAPEIRWFRRNGKLVEYTQITGRFLKLRNVTKYASGSYVCSAKNSIGEGQCDVNLSVRFNPDVEVYDDAIVLSKPRDVTLICRVTANPERTVIWTKGDNPDKLRQNSRYGLEEDTVQLESHFTKYSILTLKYQGLRDTMFDQYWCKVTGDNAMVNTATVNVMRKGVTSVGSEDIDEMRDAV